MPPRAITTCRKALDRARGDRTWRAFAAAISEAAARRCTHQAAHYWYRRGRVPAHWVRAVVHVAREDIAPRELNADLDFLGR